MSSMDAYPNDLASGFNDEGRTRPFEMFAGEAEVITNHHLAAADYPIFTIVTLGASDTVTVWNGTDFPSNGSATVVPVPMGILAQAATSGDVVPVYEAGFFNYEILKKTGNASVTLADAKRAFQGTEIHVGEIKGSNDRMVLPTV